MAGIIKNLGIHGWNYEPACDRWWVEDVCSGKRTYARMIDGKLMQFPTEDEIDWGSAVDQSRHEQPARVYGAMDPALLDLENAKKASDMAYQKRMDELFQGESHPEVDAMCANSLKPDDYDWREEVRMALRDQFAMHFLGGVIAKHGLFSVDAPNVAIRAYEFADAMMHAREMKRER